MYTQFFISNFKIQYIYPFTCTPKAVHKIITNLLDFAIFLDI